MSVLAQTIPLERPIKITENLPLPELQSIAERWVENRLKKCYNLAAATLSLPSRPCLAPGIIAAIIACSRPVFIHTIEPALSRLVSHFITTQSVFYRVKNHGPRGRFHARRARGCQAKLAALYNELRRKLADRAERPPTPGAPGQRDHRASRKPLVFLPCFLRNLASHGMEALPQCVEHGLIFAKLREGQSVDRPQHSGLHHGRCQSIPYLSGGGAHARRRVRNANRESRLTLIERAMAWVPFHLPNRRRFRWKSAWHHGTAGSSVFLSCCRSRATSSNVRPSPSILGCFPVRSMYRWQMTSMYFGSSSMP